MRLPPYSPSSTTSIGAPTGAIFTMRYGEADEIHMFVGA